MNLLATKTGRRILFASLYASEGAPIGFIWWALPTKLRLHNYTVEEITGLTSVLVLPWVFKFLWSPFIDALRTERWTLKSWIITLQLLMGAALIPFAVIPFDQIKAFLLPLLFTHALFASSQDAAIDALAISEVPEHERGSANGWMQAGMLVGRSFFGGGSLVAASLFGDQALIAGLVAMIWLSSILLLFSRESNTAKSRSAGFQTFIVNIKVVIKRSSTWWGLVFAALAGAAYEGIGSVAGPYLLDNGYTSEQTGFFFAAPAVVGMGLGALAGGYIADKIGTRKAVAIFLILTSLSAILLGGLGVSLASPATIIIILTVLYIAIGLFTASSYALFMEITHPKIGATQFSLYMGMTNVCESWSAFAVGRMAGLFGYSPAFIVMGVFSLFTLPIVRKLHRESSEYA